MRTAIRSRSTAALLQTITLGASLGIILGGALFLASLAGPLNWRPVTTVLSPTTCTVTYARADREWRQCADGTMWQVQADVWTRQPQLESVR